MRRLFLALTLTACSTTQPPLDPTYENVAAIFETSCSFRTSCHGGTRGAARLNFELARTEGLLYTDLLVGQPACEYDFMPLIDPGHPENSWLYVKVTQAHDADGYIEFEPDPAWDPGITPDDMGVYPRSICPLTEDGALTFGEIMPDGSSNGLDARRANVIRDWILAGAPGPDGTPTPPRDAGPRPVDAGRDAASSDVGSSDVGPSDAGDVDAGAGG
jgi:hypothetical protein